MKLKFVSGLIQIASLRFIEALKGSKITLNSGYLTSYSNRITSVHRGAERIEDYIKFGIEFFV